MNRDIFVAKVVPDKDTGLNVDEWYAVELTMDENDTPRFNFLELSEFLEVKESLEELTRLEAKSANTEKE